MYHILRYIYYKKEGVKYVQKRVYSEVVVPNGIVGQIFPRVVRVVFENEWI